MAAMLIYRKNSLKFFFPGTSRTISTKLGMYVASGTTAHHNLFKLLLWVDLDLFFGKVKFCNSGFYIEKCDSDGLFLIIADFDLEIG